VQRSGLQLRSCIAGDFWLTICSVSGAFLLRGEGRNGIQSPSRLQFRNVRLFERLAQYSARSTDVSGTLQREESAACHNCEMHVAMYGLLNGTHIALYIKEQLDRQGLAPVTMWVSNKMDDPTAIISIAMQEKHPLLSNNNFLVSKMDLHSTFESLQPRIYMFVNDSVVEWKSILGNSFSTG
jgi:hypothetical protein